jgi:exportin-1
MTQHLMTTVCHYTGIRNFIVQAIVDVASDETRLRTEKAYVNKLNLVLVQVRPPV